MSDAAAKPLWTPSQERKDASNLTKFARGCAAAGAPQGQDFDTFHKWTVEEMETFWSQLWDQCGVVGEKGERVVEETGRIVEARFFPDASLSFAENLLRGSGAGEAIVFRGEDAVQRRLSFDDLCALVSRLQQAMAAAGVKKGDRVAAMVPNMPETIACMLAANSLGAVWSSCSPDFGEQGVLDRFSQIEPVMFIACDGYRYNGKWLDVTDKVDAVSKVLGCKTNVLLPYGDEAVATAKSAVSLADFIAPFKARPVEFLRLPFDHPLYILFSSGTTGIPKCIVHRQGGVLLQHLKEHWLHCNISKGDRVFYFTTCGWMMWNWLVSSLALEATLMLYDGSPFYPGAEVIFDYAEQEKFDFFGTSAKFIDAVRNSGLRPIESHDLSSVKSIASTGSPLAPENFAFVYDGIKKDVHLASVSGGTDIVSCFVSAVAWNPVFSGEIQGPAIGMDTDVWNDDGKSIRQEKGELVCTNAFPSIPLGFWNDEDGSRFHEAYFDRFDNVWCHGDFAEWTANGGMVIHGRSDATLNPGGVRIGTAEIYNQVEQMPEVEEALCIGQEWESDTRVVLFVRLADGVALDEALTKAIKTRIRTGASPRHVPQVIVEVADIPRTKSGKIVELAVRDVVHGRKVKNKEALANPEALDLFAERPELAS
jgi:acetoacetyl-CoA synthetase